MAVEIQGGAAQPVQMSGQAPSAGPAIPIAVMSDSRPVLAGPVQAVVEVTDGRMRMGGAAIPVVVGSGNGFTIAGPPMPVYVVSGSLGGNPPVNTVLPVISGTQAPGAILSTTDGTWTNTPTSYAYQWKRAGVAIGSATNNTYVVQSADIGTTITVTVTASNVAGSASATSAGVAISALHASLISYWKLDEVNGNRSDSVIATANTLTDNNTVTSNPGKINLAGQFTRANSETLSRASNASFQTGLIDFTFALWIYFDTLVSFEGSLSKDDGTNREYGFLHNDIGLIQFYVFTPLGVYTPVNSTTTAVVATWYFIVGWHTNGVGLSIQVNNGSIQTVALTTGVKSSTAPFVIGCLGGSYYLNGRIDEVGFWKRVLTAGERTSLYNAGNGYSWPFV